MGLNSNGVVNRSSKLPGMSVCGTLVLAIVDWWLAAAETSDPLLLEMLKRSCVGLVRSAATVFTNLQGSALLALSVFVEILKILVL